MAYLAITAVLIGLAADAGSVWETLRVGELKTLCALACGDLEAVAEGCEWIRHFGQIDADRLRVYRCIESLLDIGEDDQSWLPVLNQLYGEPVLQQAQALLEGRQRFFGLQALGPNYETSVAHQKLLAAYAKVQSRKQ